MEYSNVGNIVRKTDAGELGYSLPGKPYAVSNQTISSSATAIPLREQLVRYTSFDRPLSIEENDYRADFSYNAFGDRKLMTLTSNNAMELSRYYLGNCYEKEVSANGATTERLYLDGTAYDASSVWVKEGGVEKIYYIHRDHLGSITQLSNEAGAKVAEYSYDAWGRLRNPQTLDPYGYSEQPTLLLGRGYTGHEHLPWFGLVNMNARLYDPVLGRFLSPDPYVQLPDFSQSFNRYSYCLNNPLMYVDPTGEQNRAPWDNWQWTDFCEPEYELPAATCTAEYPYRSYYKSPYYESPYYRFNMSMEDLYRNGWGSTPNDDRIAAVLNAREAGKGMSVAEQNLLLDTPAARESMTSKGLNSKEVSAVFSDGSMFIGTVGAWAEDNGASFRLTNSKGILTPRWYSNGWAGNQWGLTTKVAKVGKVVSGVGTGLGGLSLIADLNQYSKGEMSGGRFAYHTGSYGTSTIVAYLGGGVAGVFVGGSLVSYEMLFDQVVVPMHTMNMNVSRTMKKPASLKRFYMGRLF